LIFIGIKHEKNQRLKANRYYILILNQRRHIMKTVKIIVILLAAIAVSIAFSVKADEDARIENRGYIQTGTGIGHG